MQEKIERTGLKTVRDRVSALDRPCGGNLSDAQKENCPVYRTLGD